MGVGEKYKQLGATDEEVQTMVQDARTWAEDVDGWFAIMQGTIICPV